MIGARRWLWPRSLGGKTAVVAVAMALLLVVAWTTALLLMQRRFDRAIAVAKTLGYRATWEEMVGPAVPDSENAAIPIREAGVLAAKALDQATVTRAKLDGDESQLLSAAAKLIGDPTYERLIDEAANRNAYRTLIESSEIGQSGLVKLSCFYDVSRIELATARTWMKSGRNLDAVRRIVRLLALTRTYVDNEPRLLAHYIGHYTRASSIRVLNQLLRGDDLPPDVHEEIEAELARHDVARTAVRGLYGSLEDFLEWRRRRAHVFQSPIVRPFAFADAAHTVELHNVYARTVDLPYGAAKPLLRIPGPLGRVPLLGADREAGELVDQARRCFALSTADLRCCRIVNAMAARKNFNAELGALGLPVECLVDPLDGERLRIRRTPDGPIVYSVGMDLGDDGGQLDIGKRPWDVGLGPVKKSTSP